MQDVYGVGSGSYTHWTQIIHYFIRQVDINYALFLCAKSHLFCDDKNNNECQGCDRKAGPCDQTSIASIACITFAAAILHV